MVPDQQPTQGDAVAGLIGAVIGVTLVLLFTAVLVTLGFNGGVIPAAEALGVKTDHNINILDGLFISVFAYAVFGRHTLALSRGK